MFRGDQLLRLFWWTHNKMSWVSGPARQHWTYVGMGGELLRPVIRPAEQARFKLLVCYFFIGLFKLWKIVEFVDIFKTRKRCKLVHIFDGISFVMLKNVKDMVANLGFFLFPSVGLRIHHSLF